MDAIEFTHEELKLIREFATDRMVSCRSFMRQADPRDSPSAIKLVRRDNLLCDSIIRKLNQAALA